MNNCGNCANYDRIKMEHTNVCGKCITAYVGTVRKEPSNWKPMPQTNADRIRAMSDEELADVIRDGSCCPDGYAEKCCSFDTCNACWVEWLKQPAEDQ